MRNPLIEWQLLSATIASFVSLTLPRARRGCPVRGCFHSRWSKKTIKVLSDILQEFARASNPIGHQIANCLRQAHPNPNHQHVHQNPNSGFSMVFPWAAMERIWDFMGSRWNAAGFPAFLAEFSLFAYSAETLGKRQNVTIMPIKSH